MHHFNIFTLFWAMVLAGCVAAAPLDPRQVFYKRMTLGYRTVSPVRQLYSLDQHTEPQD